VRRVFPQQSAQHWGKRPRTHRPSRLLGGQRHEDGAGAWPSVRRTALDGGIQRGAERPEVRPLRGLQTARLLRCHERRRAEDQPRLSDGRIALERGDAEVGEHNALAFVQSARGRAGFEQDVRRLHVAVDDPGRVRGAQRVEDPQADPRHLGRRQRPGRLDQFGEGTARDELHDDPGQAVLLYDVVDRHDARVFEPGRRPGLADGPGAKGRPFRLADHGRQDEFLDGDVPAQRLVAGPPDRPHATPADDLDKVIAARHEPTRILRHKADLSDRRRAPR
jgi:hypothetical protein